MSTTQILSVWKRRERGPPGNPVSLYQHISAVNSHRITSSFVCRLIKQSIFLYIFIITKAPTWLIICYIYIALFWDTQIALHRISSNPLGWCNGSHIASERPPHTSLLVERRQWWSQSVDMGMIRRPWWSEANGQIWPGHRGNTLTLFRRTSWDF